MPPPSSWVFHSQFSMISLPPAWPGSQKRKYSTFYFSTGLQSNQWGKKKKKKEWSRSARHSASVPNTPTAHTWLLNFPNHSESDRIWKLPVILRKWTSGHLWRWAMRHLSGQTGPQGSSWYLLHSCIRKGGREGKDSRHTDSSDHAGLFSV